MTETKWTPGPWSIDKGYIVSEDLIIATIFPHFSEADKANAHLIAAAPDLYEALDRAAQHYHGTTEEYPHRYYASFMECPAERCRENNAALARARGEA